MREFPHGVEAVPAKKEKKQNKTNMRNAHEKAHEKAHKNTRDVQKIVCEPLRAYESTD